MRLPFQAKRALKIYARKNIFVCLNHRGSEIPEPLVVDTLQGALRNLPHLDKLVIEDHRLRAWLERQRVDAFGTRSHHRGLLEIIALLSELSIVETSLQLDKTNVSRTYLFQASADPDQECVSGIPQDFN